MWGRHAKQSGGPRQATLETRQPPYSRLLWPCWKRILDEIVSMKILFHLVLFCLRLITCYTVFSIGRAGGKRQ
jgi:hypothetical protein